jgi:hypothetical protein
MKLNKTETKLVSQLQIGAAPELVANRFSGETIELVPTAVAVYDYIMGCERIGDYKGMNLGLNMFRKYWTREYMVLLD